MYMIRRTASRATTKVRLTASVESVFSYNNLVVNKLCIHDVMVCGEMWICRRYAPFGAASAKPELSRKVGALASKSGEAECCRKSYEQHRCQVNGSGRRGGLSFIAYC